MLETLREMSIAGWKPIGEIISAIFDSSGTWVPIIAYFIIALLGLFLLRLILDRTVSTASSLSLSIIWKFFKKLVLYSIIIGVVSVIVISLYFYLESMYHEYDKENTRIEHKKQSVDYLLLD